MGGVVVSDNRRPAWMALSASGGFWTVRPGRSPEWSEEFTGELDGDGLFLASFASLSVQTFAFPFTGKEKIRQALLLKTGLFANGEKGTHTILPMITDRSSGVSRGSAWFLPPGELEVRKDLGLGKQASFRTLPACLVLGSQIDGEGVAIWNDGDLVTSIIWSEGLPLLCRTFPARATTLAKERDWCERYRMERKLPTGPVVAVDAAKGERAADLLFQSAENICSSGHPASLLDFSRQSIESEARSESRIRLVSKVAIALAVAGVLFAAGSGLRLYAGSSHLKAIDQESARIYREVFGGEGPVTDPLSQARARIGNSADTGASMHLSGVLGILGTVFSGADLDGVSLDRLNYSDNGFQIRGSAPDMSMVQLLRRSLTDAFSGIEAGTGDIQQIPGGGIRFTMDIREAAR